MAVRPTAVRPGREPSATALVTPADQPAELLGALPEDPRVQDRDATKAPNIRTPERIPTPGETPN